MGDDLVYGEPAGGGTKVAAKKITVGREYYGFMGANGPNDKITNAMGKFNALMTAGGLKIVRIDFNPGGEGDVELGYLVLPSAGRHLDKRLAAANSNGNPVNWVNTFLSETFEMALPGKNDPGCSGQVVIYDGSDLNAQYTASAHNIGPMSALYALAARNGR
jgi:hypothetical protein